jgi:hypothetical protein
LKEIKFVVHGIRLLNRSITAAEVLKVQNNIHVRYDEIHSSFPQTVKLLRQKKWLLLPSSRAHRDSGQTCSLTHYKVNLTRLQQIMKMLSLVPHVFHTSLHFGIEILLGK